MSCECFTCANGDDYKSCKAYLMGQFEAYRDILNQLKDLGIEPTTIADNSSIGGIMSRVQCNMDDSGAILSSPEFHDIKFKGKLAKELFGE